MKLYIKINILLILCLASCKKDENAELNNGNPYFVKFKINGNEKVYTAPENCAIINRHQNQDTLFSSIFAAWKSDDDYTKNGLGILIGYSTPISEGTYTNYTPSNPSEIKITMAINYTDNFGINSTNFGEGFIFFFPNYIADGKLIIQELSTTFVKAEFSGSLYDSANNPPKYIVSEGKLYMKRIE